MKLYDLRTNHIFSPLGIDKAPEFSWRISDEMNNVYQICYRIAVFDGEDCVWDSGRIYSDKQSFVRFGGELKAFTRYRWHVEVGNNYGESAEAEALFETAMLSEADWCASWVESCIPRNEPQLFTYGIENPVLLFEREFETEKEILSARLYASAYGCYRVLLNGTRPDEREFAPDFTPYGKIVNYQTYDVTKLLHSGKNKLDFQVGDGWFFCAQTAIDTPEAHTAPAIIYQLEIQYADGMAKTVCSDGSETVSATNILFSDLFSGERIDLTALYSEKYAVIKKDYPLSVLRAQPMPPIMPIELIPAENVYVSPKGETIVDFGQVIAGRARIRINAPRGRELMFEYTEVVDENKNYFSTMSLRQCDTVVADGSEFIHEALFTFHGFRYIRVTGMDNARQEDFTAVLLSTQKENAGDFTCDDKRFERLYKNIRYSQKNNMLSIPTDCPTREKAGWTGDILIYSETAMLNEDMTPFLTSWLEGLKADQLASGVVPLISPLTKLYKMVAMQQMVPRGAAEQTGIAGWGDAIIWVPYSMYKVTGDMEILSACLPAMKRWADYIIRTAEAERGSELPYETDRYLWNTGFHFGEWLVPGRVCEGFEVCKESAGYIAPFFGYRSMLLLSEICTILGEDGAYYSDVAAKMKNAIIDGLFGQDMLPDFLMGAYVLAFAFDLVPEEYKEEYLSRLTGLIEKNGCALATGFLATPFLLDTLDKLGRHDLAKAILFNNRRPSWLFEVEHGATAIWENWMALDEDNVPIKTSFDHYAFGCVDSYIFHRVCGISGDAGYRHITVAPEYDSGFTSFRRSFICEAGELIVERSGDILNVAVPCNTSAEIYWRGKAISVGSGKYSF